MTSATRSRHHLRTSSGAALAVSGLLALTGCMKVDMDLTLTEDDTASGTMILAFSDELAAEMGMEPKDLWEQGRGQLGETLPEGATEEPYADGEYTGGKYTFEEQPIEEISSEELSITREGDEYVVSGAMDLTDAATNLGGVDDGLLETFDMRVAVTFPGEVLETNGEVVGTSTVEWRPQLGEATEMRARGSAVAAEATGGASDGGFPWWVAWALIGVATLAAVVVVVVRANRPRHDEHPPPPPPPDGPTGMGGGLG